jgi:hypothetical protein
LKTISKILFFVMGTACGSSLSLAHAGVAYECSFSGLGTQPIRFQIDVNQEYVTKTIDNGPYSLYVLWERRNGVVRLELFAPNQQGALFYAKGSPPHAVVGFAGIGASAYSECRRTAAH